MQQVSAGFHESRSNCHRANSTAAKDMQRGIMDLWEAGSLQQLDNLSFLGETLPRHNVTWLLTALH
jgi:hypothetical protein